MGLQVVFISLHLSMLEGLSMAVIVLPSPRLDMLPCCTNCWLVIPCLESHIFFSPTSLILSPWKRKRLPLLLAENCFLHDACLLPCSHAGFPLHWWLNSPSWGHIVWHNCVAAYGWLIPSFSGRNPSFFCWLEFLSWKHISIKGLLLNYCWLLRAEDCTHWSLEVLAGSIPKLQPSIASFSYWHGALLLTEQSTSYIVKSDLA